MSFLLQVGQWLISPGHWQGLNGIPNRTLEHIEMSVAATLAAALIAIPIGAILGHSGRGGLIAVNVSNVGRALPSFAILVIALQFFGIGAKPAFVALVALAIPPMLTNTYVGFRGVDPEIREAAKGLGLRPTQVMLRVELPLALPIVMAGVRTSGVNVVATATLAALVAWGGLGRYIIDGLGQRDLVQVFAGAVLVAALSMVAEGFLAGLQWATTPRGLRQSRLARGRSQDHTVAAA